MHIAISLLITLCSIGNPCIADSLVSSKNINALTDAEVRYDPSYVKMKYPGGDVPADRGVCSDVIIRAYRKVGIDLQKDVHEDMKANFDKYPKRWGAKAPDTNIDHRRVPNLMTFFSRHGVVLPITKNPEDYKPGDIVCWDLGGGILHIGIITPYRMGEEAPDLVSKTGWIIHNIGYGQVVEDCLFRWKITGHYRYYGIKKGKN